MFRVSSVVRPAIGAAAAILLPKSFKYCHTPPPPIEVPVKYMRLASTLRVDLIRSITSSIILVSQTIAAGSPF